MGFIDEIEKDIWKWVKWKWKPLPRYKKILSLTMVLVIIVMIFFPKLWNEWKEWKTSVNKIFCGEGKTGFKEIKPDTTTIILLDSIKPKREYSEPYISQTEESKKEKRSSPIIRNTLRVQIGKTNQCFSGEVRIYIQTIQDRPPLRIIGKVNEGVLTACDEMAKSQAVGNYTVRVLHLEEDFADFEITKTK